MKILLSVTSLGVLLIAGCATTYDPEEPESGSPTGALIRGELEADDYVGAITDANEATRAGQQFEFNREPTRAFNTKTERIEYVPDGTDQRWNEKHQRWEFTPIN